MSDLERSVAKFISEDGGGPGGRFESLETIEQIYDTLKLVDIDKPTLKLVNIDKPELDFFTKKVNEYLLFFKMEGIRNKRNKMLSECDWTQMNDVQLSDDAEWKAYRQLLRDLPSVIDLQKPLYPLKPGDPEPEVVPEPEPELVTEPEPELVTEPEIVGEKLK